MKIGSQKKKDFSSKEWVFDRRLFVLLLIHWALTIIAVLVFIFLDNEIAYEIYIISGYIITFILFFASFYLLRDTKWRYVLPELERFSKVLLILMLLFAVLFLFCLGNLSRGGPKIYNGKYCLWNHGFVREITCNEYVRLSIIERTSFTSIIALFGTGFMYKCCYADRIE